MNLNQHHNYYTYRIDNARAAYACLVFLTWMMVPSLEENQKGKEGDSRKKVKYKRTFG